MLNQTAPQELAKISFYLFKELGLKRSKYDSCFYVKRVSVRVILLSFYVNDFHIAGSTLCLLLLVKNELSNRFEVVACGKSKLGSGLEIARDCTKRRLKVCQAIYAFKMLDKFEMQDCKQESTAMDGPIVLKAVSSESFCNAKHLQAHDSVIYLMIFTWPDIVFSVGQLLQQMKKPAMGLLGRVKRVLRHINGTAELGLAYTGSRGLLEIEGFCDAEWAGCKQDR